MASLITGFSAGATVVFVLIFEPLPQPKPVPNAVSVAATIHIATLRFNELRLGMPKQSNVAASRNGRQFDAEVGRGSRPRYLQYFAEFSGTEKRAR